MFNFEFGSLLPDSEIPHFFKSGLTFFSERVVGGTCIKLSRDGHYIFFAISCLRADRQVAEMEARKRNSEKLLKIA